MLYDPKTLLALEGVLRKALPLWGYASDHKVELLNYSENVTFRLMLEGENDKVIRLHRPNYHDRIAIESELCWLSAIRKASVVPTPTMIAGLDGRLVQELARENGTPYYLVMGEYIDGEMLAEDQDLRALYTQLGRIAAGCHQISRRWRAPLGFSRPHWDDRSVFGTKPLWGHWRDEPHVKTSHTAILYKAQHKLCAQLAAYGQDRQRFGMIHADMRLANLLVTEQETYLIDFDDCGFGWYLYDFAAAISFIEDHPSVPEWKQCWQAGYQQVCPLSEQDFAIMDSLVMLRRLNLLGWMGTHPEVEIVQTCSSNFANVTVELAQKYLRDIALYER